MTQVRKYSANVDNSALQKFVKRSVFCEFITEIYVSYTVSCYITKNFRLKNKIISLQWDAIQHTHLSICWMIQD